MTTAGAGATESSASSFERLSAQDASFLYFEGEETPMHVAGVAILETGDLATADGGVDAGRLAKYTETRLPELPRYRRRILQSPANGLPVWIDDEDFRLERHLKRIAAPRPGDASSLKEIVGWILSQPLDRRHPLWEMWIVEGLDAGRFALVVKTHHCMVDGASGVNLLTLLMSPTPQSDPPPAREWTPQPAPTSLELLSDELRQRTQLARTAAARIGSALRRPRAALDDLLGAGAAVGEALATGLRRPAETPLNRPIGRDRRIDWHSVELDRVKAIKNALGGTVNDVVLAAVAGGLRRFMDHREADISHCNYRVVIPVNMRGPDDDFSDANHVSALLLSLPTSEPDPHRRYEAVCRKTSRLKKSRVAEGTDLLLSVADWVGGSWLSQVGTRLTSALRPYNLIVTNVPGPQLPLYILGSRLVEIFPMLPLFDCQGLGVAVMSYDGHVGCGMIGDRELLPDLVAFREAVEDAFDELHDLAVSSRSA